MLPFLTASAFVALGTLLSAAPQQDSWIDYKVLTWEDFQGAPPDPLPAGKKAESAIQLEEAHDTVVSPLFGPTRFKATIKNLTVAAKFNTQESWKSLAGLSPAAAAKLLHHEQGHFALAQAFAASMEKALNGISETSALGSEDAKAKAEAELQYQWLNQMEAYLESDQAYDDDTDHGQNDAAQGEWDDMILLMLEAASPADSAAGATQATIGFDADSKSIGFTGLSVDAFHAKGGALDDAVLAGGSIALPALTFAEFYVGSQHPVLMPQEASPIVRILLADGTTALEAKLLVLLGDEGGSLFTGWLENPMIARDLLGDSPLLQCFDAAMASGGSLLTIAVEVPGSLTQLTADFTQSASIGAKVLIGTAVFGIEAFGVGIPGCNGAHELSVNATPQVGLASFAFACTRAPAGATGLLLLGDAQEPAGSDPFGLGVPLYVSLESTSLAGLGLAADERGVATAAAPIPNDPSLAGRAFYAQALFAWAAPCSPSPYSLSASHALALEVQP